ncbi:MAG: two-component system cell cycle sensor histidine kinase/response regulator CckA [Candidatus Pelagisphaera sp.]|jgi:two-component system cell cycle sensor histidine kinase/response regulator CckA
MDFTLPITITLLLIAIGVALRCNFLRKQWRARSKQLEEKLKTSMTQVDKEITDSQNSREAQIASEKRVHSIADSIPILISYVDTDHRFQFNNKTYEEWFGAEPGAFIEMHLRDALGTDVYEKILPQIETALTGEPQIYENTMSQHGVGERFVQVRYVPDMSDDGKVIGFYSAITDLTNRKNAEKGKAELEARLRRSQKLKTIGSLAGGIAHDFNNILTPILGYTDLALLSIPPTDPLHEDLQRILKGTLRAKDLVEQILLYSKEMEKERKSIDLGSIVSEALKLLRPSIPTTVRIEKRIDSNCAEIIADASQMHQVVVNLCTNAWQAMEHNGGTITIELEKAINDQPTTTQYSFLAENEYIRLSITDTGIGMDSEHLDRIFEPFFTTKITNNEGTGLGLPIVHGIITTHGGNIVVDSIPGEGTSFHVYLPVATSSKQAPPAAEQTIQGGNETILIVDDEESITTLLQKMLETFGYFTEAYNNNIEALDAFRDNPEKYDLVITDLTMPNLTGLELSMKLQAIRPGTPIIITTGFSNKLDDETLENYNIKCVLDKPVVMRDLASEIRSALETDSA